METVLEILDYLRDLNLVSMLVRIGLAALAGGLVGIERGFHGRAAGLRTHMLVCLGAALSALIGCYLAAEVGGTDAQRTGAQVMSGVGFLGAGTILLKKGNSQITGLTTAAGLWATAAIGLSIGYGLYEPAFVTVFVVVFAFTLMSRVEFRMNRKRQRMFFYLEIDSVGSVRKMIETLSKEYAAVEIQVTPARSGNAEHVGIEALIRIPPKVTVEAKIAKLDQLDHVIFALQIT
ncbi:MAG: MgtC/SapB family protein [Clostridia bacterium]|nr:MgtC/SapB family protein [Clostridia bacterium]